MSILASLALAVIPAGAQEAIFANKSTVLMDENFRNTLWFNSNNAAGLGFAPLANYGNVDLNWDFEKGNLATQQSAEKFNDVSLKTSGAVGLKGWNLWGSFVFQNKFDTGCRYNCTVYEIDNLMPYYAADTTLSGWNRQNYELSMKMACPILWDRVCFGLEINYDCKVGAKQRDPRTETYKYRIDINPAVTIQLGKKNRLGLVFRYENGFERSQATNANSRFDQTIWLMNGLGNATTWKVGGNDGMKIYYYKANLFGGSLQWGCSDTNLDILLELAYNYKDLEGFTTPTLPKRMGRTAQNHFNALFQCMFGNDKSNKINFDAEVGMSDGYEPVQQRDDTPTQQQWVLLAENKLSSFNLITANLSYDHLFGNQDKRGYDWRVAANANFRMQDDSYNGTACLFNNKNIALNVQGDKQFKLKSTAIRLGADVLYNKSLGGEYVFTGLTTKLLPIQGLYKNDLTFWTSDYCKAGLSLDCNFQLKKLALDLCVNAGYAQAIGREANRITAGAKFGIIF